MATGSLSGKADATLVKAATDAAMAKVPFSMAPIHKRIMAARSVGMQGIATAFNKFSEAAGNIGAKLVENSKKKKLTNAPSNSYGFQEDFTPTEQDKEKRKIELDKEREKSYLGDNRLKTLTTELDAEKDESKRKKIEEKIKKRKLKVDKRTDKQIAGRFYATDEYGEDEEVQIQTVEQQVLSVRNLIRDLKRGKGDYEGDEWQGKENKEKKNKELSRLREVKENIKLAPIAWKTNSEIIEEGIKNDNINWQATQSKNPIAGMFLKAMQAGADNKALEEDATYEDKNGKVHDIGGARVVRGSNSKGETVLMLVDRTGKQVRYEGEPVTVKPADLKSLFVVKSPTLRGNMQTATDRTANQQDGYYGRDFNIGRIDDAIDEIRELDHFVDASHNRADMKSTLAESLHGVVRGSRNSEAELRSTELSEKIFGSLLSVTEKDIPLFDISGDGQLTKEDFVVEDAEERMSELKGVVEGYDDKKAKLNERLKSMRTPDDEGVIAFSDEEITNVENQLKKLTDDKKEYDNLMSHTENYTKLIKYILDGTNLKLSKDVLRSHMEIEARSIYDAGVARRNKGTKTDAKGKYDE